MRRVAFPALALALAVAGAPDAPATNLWTGTGPEGGLVTAVAIDPTNPLIVYAGFEGGGSGGSTQFPGGIFKSTDGGQTWKPALSGLSGSPVRSIAIDPANSDTIYAGTEGGIYKTESGGDSWSLMDSPPGTPLLAYDVVIHPAVHTTLFAAASDGIALSANSGLGWTLCASVTTDTRTVAFDPASPSILHTMGYLDQMFTSTDGGLNWSPSATNQTRIKVWKLVIDPTDSTHLWAATDGGLFTSIDGGATFAMVAGGLPAVRVLSLVLRGSRLYAGTAAAGVFVSENGGVDWAPANTGLGTHVIRSIAVSPLDDVDAFAGTDAGVSHTVDAGAHWTPRNSGIVRTWVTTLTADPRVTGAFDAGTTSGLFRTTDRGATWTRLDAFPEGYPTATTIDPTDSLVLYAATSKRLPDDHSESRIFRSIDGGATWQETGFPATTTAIVDSLIVDPTAPATVYAAGRGMNVIKSIDSGTTWDPASTGLTDDLILSLVLDQSHPGTLYAGTVDHLVFKTTDGAAHWNELPGSPFRATALAIATGGVLYAGSSGIFRSSDGGASWQPRCAGLCSLYPLTVQAIAVDPRRPSSLYVSATGGNPDGSDGGVFESLDGAASWHPRNAGLATYFTGQLSIDSRAPFVLVGTVGGAGVFSSLIPYADVSTTSPFANAIDAVTRNGITLGCGQGNYCPDDLVTRAQMAIFILRGEHGGAYQPPPATGTVFTDVPSTAFGAPWIEQLAAEKISTGCGNGNYCPDDSVARDQMAVFLLRGKNGGAYKPPAATGGVFGDVTPATYLAAWIEQMPAQGISSGCGGGNYCPAGLVTRAQMAAFLTRAFGLQ